MHAAQLFSCWVGVPQNAQAAAAAKPARAAPAQHGSQPLQCVLSAERAQESRQAAIAGKMQRAAQPCTHQARAGCRPAAAAEARPAAAAAPSAAAAAPLASTPPAAPPSPLCSPEAGLRQGGQADGQRSSHQAQAATGQAWAAQPSWALQHKPRRQPAIRLACRPRPTCFQQRRLPHRHIALRAGPLHQPKRMVVLHLGRRQPACKYRLTLSGAGSR